MDGDQSRASQGFVALVLNLNKFRVRLTPIACYYPWTQDSVGEDTCGRNNAAADGQVQDSEVLREREKNEKKNERKKEKGRSNDKEKKRMKERKNVRKIDRKEGETKAE